MTTDLFLEYAGWKTDSCDDGPGIRSVLFLQGCSKNCPGCHNAKTHRAGNGQLASIEELLAVAEENCCNRRITISGGEPLEQPDGVIKLLEGLQEKDFNICLYTGWSLHQVPTKVIHYLDYLKTGSFEVSNRNAELQYVGSTNQHMFQIQDGRLIEIDIGNRSIH